MPTATSPPVRFVASSYLQYALFCQFCRLSILRDFILHVIGIGSQKQMRGIDASRIIALMETLDTRRDGAILELPCESMRDIEYLFVADLTVTAGRLATCP